MRPEATHYVLTNMRLMSVPDDAAAGLGMMDAAAMVVQADKITWLGKHSELPEQYQGYSQVNLEGTLLTPGLIDCHTHLVYAGDRSTEFEQRLSGISYAEIAAAGGGIVSTVKETRAASEQSIFEQSSQRLQALLNDGVTTVEIKSGYGLDHDTELRMLAVSKKLALEFPVTVRSTYLGAHSLPPEYDQQSSLDRNTAADNYIEFICTKMLPEVAEKKLADAVDVFCEHIGFSLAQTERVFKTASELGLPVKLHAEQLSDMGGAGLVAKYQGLSADHLEYVNVEDIQNMAKHGTVAVLLPGAFYFLKEKKLPPIDELRKAGVPMAIATDSNPGSSPLNSLQLIMHMACTLFSLTPIEAWRGVTLNAALALGIADTHGSLAVGKQADFCVWNVSEPAYVTYQFGVNPLRAVYRNGLCVKGAL